MLAQNGKIVAVVEGVVHRGNPSAEDTVGAYSASVCNSAGRRGQPCGAGWLKTGDTGMIARFMPTRPFYRKIKDYFIDIFTSVEECTQIDLRGSWKGRKMMTPSRLQWEVRLKRSPADVLVT